MRLPWPWLAAAGVATAVAAAAWVVLKPIRTRTAGPLPPLTAAQDELRARLRGHVDRLASTIGERTAFHPPALEAAAVYVEEQLRAQGGEVARQAFPAQGHEVRNLEVERRGASRPGEIVVIGAHYDSVLGAPGANDNGSGVAALLEIARLLRGRALARTLRLVAFVNEEPPFFQTDEMGSLQYARRCKARGEDVVAMLSLETIGYYSDAPRSQSYPAGLGLAFPSTGDFIGLVGDLRSRALVRTLEASLARHSAVPCVAAALPGGIPGVGWSDHWALWHQGYRAVMVTDTAPFRYPAYHTEADTPEKLDYARMARVVEGLAQAIAELAGG